ncbi:reverse transcriptase domain-containing protein [Tanacetum coccineum]
MPEIDQKLESLEGFKLTCFLDAYKGYHQICMAKEDEEKTSFHTEQGTFCYEKMSFGLKNAGATYQRLMDNVFASRLGRNIEIYVDGMIIKRKNEGNLISDIAKTFDTLCKANMKLNLKKFTFRVEVGQFLGYMITNEGIQANLEKVHAIINMASPRTLREVQALNGKLATLGRFLAKSVERSLAFFKTLKVPKSGETLILYLAAATEAISAVLLTDRGNVQKPIYFVSRALQGLEFNYPNLEKVALALAIELGEHEIIYKPRSAIKGQILADFLAESLMLDNFSKEEGSGAGLILTDPDGREVTYALRFNFRTSSNEAKYEALVAGLELAIQMKAQQLNVYTYSLLITNQMKGLYKAREELMKRYLSKVQELQKHFRSFTITQIPRSKNKRVDALSKLASSSFSHLTKSVLVEIVPCRNIDVKAVNIVEETTHFGSCGAHAGARSIAQKVTRLGYYWPTMYQDATKIVETCEKCQHHAPTIRQPQCELTSISIHWPFYQWGIDIVGPFPEAPGRVKFLIVTIDYFTKWVEAEPVTTITGQRILHLVWRNVVCRFGIPGIIVSDNGKQFSNNPFREWWLKGKTQKSYRAMGQRIAKRSLGISNNGSCRKRMHPFSLVYGSEAVLSPEIVLPTYRVSNFDPTTNDANLRLNLDLLEERRELASLRNARASLWGKRVGIVLFCLGRRRVVLGVVVGDEIGVSGISELRLRWGV